MSTDVLTQPEIDNLLQAMSSDNSDLNNLSSPGSKASQRPKKIKNYDFKRPGKFSKEHIRTVRMLHETFCRMTTTSLSAQLRTLVQVHVVAVDQLTYEEFVRSIPQATTLAVLQMDPLRGNSILEVDPVITFTMIDRLFGGKGESTKEERELTDIEKSVMESIIVRLLSNIRESWSQVIDLRPRLANIETNAQFAQIVPPTEMVILVTLEVRIGDIEGMMNFCYPYITLESIMSKLSAEFFYTAVRKGTNTEDLSLIKNRLNETDVDILVEIGTLDISIKDVLSLRIGSFIRIPNSTIESFMIIKIGNKPKFRGKPGLRGKKVCIKITEQLENITSGDIDEFLIWN